VKLVAVDGDERLTVRFDPEPAVARHAVSAAGTPVGTCHCEGELVATGGEVTCLDCEEGYAVPRGGRVADTTCDACGLPELSVQRGEQFRVCLDRDCRPLSAAVAAALDGRVDCPDCSASLRVEQHRGRQFLGCDDYPDCEATFSIPAGVIVGTCACGLPVFDRGTDRRCLDAACPHDGPAGESEPDTVEETGVDAIVGTELEESPGSEESVEGEEARDD
jgi:DNA topoisomerase-1